MIIANYSILNTLKFLTKVSLMNLKKKNFAHLEKYYSIFFVKMLPHKWRIYYPQTANPSFFARVCPAFWRPTTFGGSLYRFASGRKDSLRAVFFYRRSKGAPVGKTPCPKRKKRISEKDVRIFLDFLAKVWYRCFVSRCIFYKNTKRVV